MKKLVTMVIVMLAVLAFGSMAFAAGQFEAKCAACHKAGDKPALSKESLLKKHKTAAAFVKAGMEINNPMMNAFKNEELLKSVAKELYKK